MGCQRNTTSLDVLKKLTCNSIESFKAPYRLIQPSVYELFVDVSAFSSLTSIFLQLYSFLFIFIFIFALKFYSFFLLTNILPSDL